MKCSEMQTWFGDTGEEKYTTDTSQPIANHRRGKQDSTRQQHHAHIVILRSYAHVGGAETRRLNALTPAAALQLRMQN